MEINKTSLQYSFNHEFENGWKASGSISKSNDYGHTIIESENEPQNKSRISININLNHNDLYVGSSSQELYGNNANGSFNMNDYAKKAEFMNCVDEVIDLILQELD